MKTKILILIMMIGLLASCFEDESNTKIEKINPIHIELGDFSTTVSVYLLDTLRIKKERMMQN